MALFDSDLYCSGDQSAWIRNATPLDLTATPAVLLQFESFYRKFSDKIYVQVSTDNSTWTDFQINSNLSRNDATTNPQTITLNISGAIASNPASVYFRFLFLSDASNGGDGCDYAWMIDDVKITEALGNDIVVQKGFTHDIIYAYDYSIMPASQLVPMVVGIEIYNIGGTAAVQAPMNVVINDGTSDVYNQATNFDLAIGVTDTLWVATGFTPLPDKTYTVTFTAPTDDNLTNNVSVPVSYQTTQTTYAQDFTTTGIFRFDRDDETSMGNIFEIINNATLYSASVKFETGTTAPYARIVLSRFNPTDATYNSVQSMEFIEEFQYNIPPSVIGNNLFTTIPFPSPMALDTGWNYVLEVRKDVAPDRIFLGGSNAGDDDFSTTCYGPFGANNATNYFLGWGFSPAIRMDFGIPAPIITSSDADLKACIGDSMTLTSSYGSGNQWFLNGTAIPGETGTTLTVSTSGSYSVSSGGLTSADAVVSFSVKPAVTYNQVFVDVCVNYADVVLIPGTPSGGVFSGNGVMDTIFDPSIGSGTHSITYTVTQNGCAGTASSSINVLECLSITENELANISIYPNPTSKMFTVTNTEKVNSIDLVDQVGRTLTSWKVNQVAMDLDVSKIAQGNYTLVFKGNNSSAVRQVQITK